MTNPVSLTCVCFTPQNRLGHLLTFSSDPWCLAESFPSSSSYFEGVCSSRRASTCSQRSPSPQITDDLPELLSQLGLIKYIDVFEQQEVIICRDYMQTILE